MLLFVKNFHNLTDVNIYVRIYTEKRSDQREGLLFMDGSFMYLL